MIPRKTTNKIIIHCSDTLGGDAAAIRTFHMAPPPNGRGWSDIGYHFVITYAGVVETGRDEELIGSHCKDENHDSIGICLIGVSEFRKEQMVALKNLVVSLLQKYGLSADKVSAHYEWPSAKVQKKTCPNLDADYLRQLIRGEIK
jgi:N-acetylmuramoyl-L-alanine amidase